MLVKIQDNETLVECKRVGLLWKILCGFFKKFKVHLVLSIHLKKYLYS